MKVSDDLIKDLRELSSYKNSDTSLGDDAADEIERLRAELAEKDAAIAQAYEDGRISACNAGKPGCPRAVEWQPIETAPKDGTWFLAISAGRDKWTGAQFRPAIVMINPDGNYVADDISDEYAEATPSEWPLTHWMPLPKEPKPQSRRGRSSERVGKLFEFRRKEKTMSNAKWKIVPAVVTDERAATAVMVAHEAGYPMIAVSVAREVIKADIAAAPEPDWEELAEQIYAYYWNDYDTNGSASLVRALKITLGSVK